MKPSVEDASRDKITTAKQLRLEGVAVEEKKLDDDCTMPLVAATTAVVAPIKPKLSTKYGLLFQKDCMDLFESIKDSQIDCIFADPPFNLGKVYGNGEYLDDLVTKEFLSWSYQWLDECIRVL